mmetsp:Transcript_81331/g.126880  ORF Transcript_81331/g.126880 Transcript_81331/m.126880 type:complete len:463 (-) Transcript_81331:330-1718(-)
MLGPDEHDEALVFLSFALGTREEDAENCGPGMYYAAAVLKMLHDNNIKCFCNLMLPEKTHEGAMAGMLGSRFRSCKVLLVLQTRGLYECNKVLLEIFTAQNEQIELIPLRFESDLPSHEQEWPHVKREDINAVMMLSAVQAKFCKYNSIPSPPYTVIDEPSVLDDLLIDLKLKVDFRPIPKDVSIEAEDFQSNYIAEKGENMDPEAVGLQAMLAAKSLTLTSEEVDECFPKQEWPSQELPSQESTLSIHAVSTATTTSSVMGMKTQKKPWKSSKKSCMAGRSMRKSCNPHVVGFKDSRLEITLERSSTVPDLGTSNMQVLKRAATQPLESTQSTPLMSHTATQRKSRATRRTRHNASQCLQKNTSSTSTESMSVTIGCMLKCDDGGDNDLVTNITATSSERRERWNRQKAQKHSQRKSVKATTSVRATRNESDIADPIRKSIAPKSGKPKVSPAEKRETTKI